MVRIGFLPSYRNAWRAWNEQLRTDSLAVLRTIEGLEVVAPAGRTPHDAVHSLDEAELVAESFERERVDGLVICPTDFGDERSAAKVAERLGVPILLYATKEPPAPDDRSLARVSDSYCGTLSIAAALHRRKLPLHFVGLCLPSDPELRIGFEDFARAVSVVKGLRNARIGQVGVRPPTFESVAYDEPALARKFGQNVIFANMDDVLSDAQGLPDDDARVLSAMAGIRAGVAQVSVAEDYLRKAARLETVLLEFGRRFGLSALAMQCWPTVQRALGISLCATFGRLTEQGLPTACEADVLGALSMLVNQRAALGRTVPHFIDWTIQHRDDPNRLLAWHCGNSPVCLAADPAQTALRSRRDMLGEMAPEPGDPMAGLAQFQLRPGPVTFCRLAESDGCWKMLIAGGEIVPTDETLAGTWSWVAVRDHARLYRTLVEEGFIHHASLIHGEQQRALEQACKFLQIEAVVVD